MKILGTLIAAVCMVSLSFAGQSFGAMAAPNLIDITGGASPPQKYIVLPVPRGHLEAIQHSPFLEMAVKDPQGSKLGKLEKLIMDSSEGKIEYAVVAMNDGRLVALPWKSFTVSRNGKSVVLTAEQEQLTTALGETAKEIKNLMRPGMMSPTYTVRGELLGVEAADYVVNDAAGKKVRLHMENGTQMAGLPKVGDTIEAKVNEFHAAISVRTVANARIDTAPHVSLKDPLSAPNHLDWITIAAADTYAAQWVKDIEQELMKEQYRRLWSNDPRSPQAAVMYLLDDSAKALVAHSDAMARDFVRRALNVLEEGISKGYYSQSDVDPIITYIKAHAPVHMS